MILLIGGAFQGKTRYARTHYADRPCYYVQTIIQEQPNPQAYLDTILENHPDAVLTLDDVGSGIVPLEKSDRDYRETVGKIGCYLALKAEKVIRVCCGIGQVIKE